MKRLSIHKDNTYEQNLDAIKDLVNNVEWDKVAKVMTFLGWEWSCLGVPTQKQLKEEAMRYALSAVVYSTEKQESYKISCGGISVDTYYLDDGSIRLDVNFVLTEWSNCL